MDQLLTINGELIDKRYLIASVCWQVMVLVLWPPLIIGFRRAFNAYKGSSGKIVDLLVYWTHLALITVCFTLLAIDPTTIYFGASGALNLIGVLEVVVLHFSHGIYSFVTVIQHYAVQQKLTAPAWIRRFKWYFVAFNFVVGNISLIIHVGVNRVWMSGLTPIVCGLEGFVIAPILIVVVIKLTNRLKEQFTTTTKSSEQGAHQQKILKGIRNFRVHTFGLLFTIYLFAAIVFIVYIPRSFEDKSLVHGDAADFPDFARTRRFKSTFKLNWIIWVAYFITTYFFYRHWIKKSSFAGKLTVDNLTSSTSNSKPNNADWSSPPRSYSEMQATNTFASQNDGGCPQHSVTFPSQLQPPRNHATFSKPPSMGREHGRASTRTLPRGFIHGFATPGAALSSEHLSQSISHPIASPPAAPDPSLPSHSRHAYSLNHTDTIIPTVL